MLITTEPHRLEQLSAPLPLESLGYMVLSTLEAPLSWPGADTRSADAYRRNPAHLWEQSTGLSPADSHFTLIVPVHNEGRGLKTFLGTLLHSYLPRDLSLQVVFIANACTDSSVPELRRFFDQLEAKQKDSPLNKGASPYPPIGEEIRRRDHGISAHPRELVRGNGRFILIETSTPGKAHALSLGNEIACLTPGCTVAIGLDSDCCPHPEALMKIFAEMHRAQRECPERPPVFSALGSFEWDFARDKPYAERLVDPQRRTHLHFNKDTPHVLGCLAAWSPQWLEAQGGFPTCVMEDYALGILAELKGGGRRRSEAQVWAYGPTSRADHWRTIRRYVQGTFQLLSMFHAEFHAAPELRKKVLSEQDWLVSPKALAKNNFEEFSRSPSAQGAVRAVYRTARALLTVAQGWWDNLRSPHQQTWQATRSTKL